MKVISKADVIVGANSRKCGRLGQPHHRHYLGRRFIAGARYEHTTYQIFMSGSAWPTIDKS